MEELGIHKRDSLLMNFIKILLDLRVTFETFLRLIKYQTHKTMNKVLTTLAIGLLAIGSAVAAPQFKEINNKHGKTTIKIEIPASDRDASNGLSIDNVKLYNNGKTFHAKKVNALWGENSTIILEFKKMTTFEDCILSFTVNGEPVNMDLSGAL